MKAVIICTLRCNYSLLYVMLMPSSFALFNSCIPIKPQKPFISTYGIFNLTQLAVNHNNSLPVLSIAVPFAWASLDNEEHFQMGLVDIFDPLSTLCANIKRNESGWHGCSDHFRIMTAKTYKLNETMLTGTQNVCVDHVGGGERMIKWVTIRRELCGFFHLSNWSRTILPFLRL